MRVGVGLDPWAKGGVGTGSVRWAHGRERRWPSESVLKRNLSGARRAWPPFKGGGLLRLSRSGRRRAQPLPGVSWGLRTGRGLARHARSLLLVLWRWHTHSSEEFTTGNGAQGDRGQHVPKSRASGCALTCGLQERGGGPHTWGSVTLNYPERLAFPLQVSSNPYNSAESCT